MWAGTIGGIQGLCRWLEKQLSPEGIEKSREWLRGKAQPRTAWVSHFAHVFDALFGTRHFTWQCFFRSCLASLSALLILTLTWVSNRPGEFRSMLSCPEFSGIVAGFVVTTLVYSFPCDYASLLKTRLLIRRLGPAPSERKLVAILALDLILTCVVLAFGLLYLRVIYSPAFFEGARAGEVYRW